MQGAAVHARGLVDTTVSGGIAVPYGGRFLRRRVIGGLVGVLPDGEVVVGVVLLIGTATRIYVLDLWTKSLERLALGLVRMCPRYARAVLGDLAVLGTLLFLQSCHPGLAELVG